MKSNIQLFEFHSKKVRTVIIDDVVWWVAKDACDLLGFKNHNDAIKLHCRGVAKYYPILDALNRSQDTRIITEDDLLRLIMGSNLPEAIQINKWVFGEVLPQIWKTGSYSLKKPSNLELARMVIESEEAKFELKRENTKLIERVDTLIDRNDRLIVRNKNLAEADDIVKTFIERKGLISVDDFSKIVQIRMKYLSEYMRGTTHRKDGKVYVNIVMRGLMELKTTVVDGVDEIEEYFTTKGAVWFYNNFIKKNRDEVMIETDHLDM